MLIGMREVTRDGYAACIELGKRWVVSVDTEVQAWLSLSHP